MTVTQDQPEGIHTWPAGRKTHHLGKAPGPMAPNSIQPASPCQAPEALPDISSEAAPVFPSKSAPSLFLLQLRGEHCSPSVVRPPCGAVTLDSPFSHPASPHPTCMSASPGGFPPKHTRSLSTSEGREFMTTLSPPVSPSPHWLPRFPAVATGLSFHSCPLQSIFHIAQK